MAQTVVALEVGTYLTDGKRLVYVLMPGVENTVVEDCSTNEEESVPTRELAEWEAVRDDG